MTAPVTARATPAQELERVLMAGDYVEVIAHHGADEDEDYSGWRGHVLAEPVPTTAENPIAIVLEGDAEFGPVLFRAEELRVIAPGRASRAYAEALGELARMTALLLRAAPMLRAGVTYHQKRAHAAHALPGSRVRAGYDNEANDALFRLRLDSSQKGADAVLAALALAPAEGEGA